MRLPTLPDYPEKKRGMLLPEHPRAARAGED
jgi:hypothetical protein